MRTSKLFTRDSICTFITCVSVWLELSASKARLRARCSSLIAVASKNEKEVNDVRGEAVSSATARNWWEPSSMADNTCSAHARTCREVYRQMLQPQELGKEKKHTHKKKWRKEVCCTLGEESFSITVIRESGGRPPAAESGMKEDQYPYRTLFSVLFTTASRHCSAAWRTRPW